MKKFARFITVAFLVLVLCSSAPNKAEADEALSGGGGNGGARIDDFGVSDVNITSVLGKTLWEPVEGKLEWIDGKGTYPLSHGLLWMDFSDDKKTVLEITGFVNYDDEEDYGWTYYLNAQKQKYKFLDDKWTIGWTDGSDELKFQFDLHSGGPAGLLYMTLRDKTAVYYAVLQPVFTMNSSNPFSGEWIAVKGSGDYQQLTGLPLKNGRMAIYDTGAGLAITGNLYYERNKNAWLKHEIRHIRRRSDLPTKISWSEDSEFSIGGKWTPMKDVFTVELLDSGEMSVKVSNRVSSATAIFKRFKN
jgi:hypothetical protein